MRRDLLIRFLQVYPFQPATALWRAVEIAQVVEHGVPEGRGVDLGCGDGLLTRIVLEEVGRRNVVGVDPDASEAAHAEDLGIYSAVHTVGGDMVPEPDGSFDWVLSNSVLEHIDQIEPVLAEVGRLLRPGGEFIFTVPGPDFHACLRGPLLPGASRDAYLRHLDSRVAHRRYWGRSEWQNALSPTGLSVVDATPYLGVGQVRRWESIARVTAGVLYTLTARKRQPIEIQRQLGLRKPGRRMRPALARLVARFIAIGLNGASGPTDVKFGCCWFKAIKSSE
ncbi:MAG: class I SAM-dependent methyltransferase [Candidatus Dormiibacterota bacterium]